MVWHELIVGDEQMPDAMLDARQEDDSYRRLEVITGKRRRRRWTAEEKVRIVRESFAEGVNVSEVARRNGVARGLLTVWREQFCAEAAARPSSFVPIRIETESPSASDEPPVLGHPKLRLEGRASAARGFASGLEIEVGGARIRVPIGVDARTLATVLLVLRGGG
jgi:transposase